MTRMEVSLDRVQRRYMGVIGRVENCNPATDTLLMSIL